MNHIKRLQLENQILKDFVNDLLVYTNSSKFAAEPMMNVGDIRLRFSEMRNKLVDNGISFELEYPVASSKP